LGFAERLAAASFSQFITRLVFDGTAKGVFVIFVVFLGLGGFLREQAEGTSDFTIALPATRRRMAAVRAAIGLLEMIALALVPALVVPVLSPLVHEAYPLLDTLRFALLWAVGGSLLFALSFLLSTLFSGEYTALLAAYVIVFAHTLVAIWRPVRPYHLNLMQTMGGWRVVHLGAQHEVLFGPLPWIRLTTIALLATTLMTISLERIQRQDF